MAQIVDTKGLVSNKLLAWIKRIQKEQDKLIKEYDRRILDYYRNKTLKNIKPKIDAVQLRMEAEPEITIAEIKKSAEYRQLAVSMAAELDEFANFATIELDLASKASIKRAVADIGILAGIINLDKVKIVTPSALDILTDYLAKDGELYKRIKSWAGIYTDRAIAEIIEGVSLGRNPVKIARLLYKQFGVSLSDAIRAMRTVQLWSYREATRANYIANSDIIKGWIWYANLDDRTCMSCLAMHGTIHPLTEPLNDHHNGRCTLLPYPQSENVIKQSGQEWFDSLSEEQKEKNMGPIIYDAYKNGMFEFSEFSKIVNDPVYGDMRSQTPLWELLGAESPFFKQGY